MKRVSISRLASAVSVGVLLLLATATPALAETVRTVTQYSYDSRNRLECTAVRMNPTISLPTSACDLSIPSTAGPDRIEKNVYDVAGQLLKVQKAYGVTTANGFPATLQQDYAAYTYSLNGKQTSVMDANGNLATMTYDGFDRQIAWSFPSKTNGSVTARCTIGTITTVNGITGPSEAREPNDDCEKYAYDANGNRAKLMKRDGQVINYSYDALNRATLKDIPGGTTKDVYYGYDLRGLQTYARFGAAGGAGIDTVYDGFGRVTGTISTMGSVSRTLGYQYDAHGNRTKITHPDGTFFTYQYDGLNRPVAVRENGTTMVAAMAWDAQGRRVCETRGVVSNPQGPCETRGVVSSAYGYDAVSRLTSITDDLAGTANDLTTGFSHNPASQIVSRTQSNPHYAFGSYTNFTRSYTVNGLNQYDAAGGASYGYDANGNLTNSTAPIPGSTTPSSTTYTYDVENRLVQSSKGASLVYDPLGRLYETAFASADTTRFLYDGDQLTLEYDASGNVLRRYVHGTGDDDPLLWYEGATLADRRSLQANHQGSVVSIADASGNAIEINKYDEYGIPAGSNIGRFQYTGQAYIAELGMYYYKARIYSPTLGRFLQTDPIGYDDQINLYAYVGNDPINGRDPTGKAQDSCLFICRLFGGSAPVKSAGGTTIGQYDRDGAHIGLTVTATAAAAQSAAYTTAAAAPLVAKTAVSLTSVTAAEATPLAFRGAERVAQTSARTSSGLTAESAVARAASPLAGTRTSTGNTAVADRTFAAQTQRARGLVGRPDQGLRPRPSTPSQRRTEIFRQILRLFD